jgi:hypothetical protein
LIRSIFTFLSAINGSRSFWTRVEFVCVAVVFLGVLGEYIGDFTHWASENPDEAHRLGKRATLWLVMALAVEFVSLVHTTNLADLEIAQLQLKAEDEKLALAHRKPRLTPTSTFSEARSR